MAGVRKEEQIPPGVLNDLSMIRGWVRGGVKPEGVRSLLTVLRGISLHKESIPQLHYRKH